LENPSHPEVRSISLRLRGEPGHSSNGNVQLIMQNVSSTPIKFNDDLGLALLGKKSKNGLSPSDGASDAWITRQHLKTIDWGDKNQWHIKVDDSDLMKLNQEVPAKGIVIIHMQICLPPGEYNLVCGYGGNVHAYYCSASNLLAITISADKAISFK